MRVTKIILLAALLSVAHVLNVGAADQDIVIEGAKKEGALVVYTSMTVDQMQKILDAFKARYPFIRTTMFRAVGERLLTKIMYRSANREIRFRRCSIGGITSLLPKKEKSAAKIYLN
jgi:hypothetical protein